MKDHLLDRHWNPAVADGPEPGVLRSLAGAVTVFAFCVVTIATGCVLAFEVLRMMHPSVVIDLTEPQPFGEEDPD